MSLSSGLSQCSRGFDAMFFGLPPATPKQDEHSKPQAVTFSADLEVLETPNSQISLRPGSTPHSKAVSPLKLMTV